MRHYFNATGIRVFAILLSGLGGFFLVPYLLNSLGENDFGIWSIAAAITSYFLLVDFGVSLACTRFLSLSAKHQNDWPKIITNSLAFAFWVAMLLIVIGLVLITIVYAGGWWIEQKKILVVIAIVAIESGISMSLRVYQSVLRANVLYIQLGLFELARIILRLGGIFLLLYAGYGLIPLVIYSGLINVLFFATSLGYVYQRYGQSFFQSRLIHFHEVARLFHFGKYAIVVQIGELFRYRMDGIFVGVAMGLSAVAHYALLITIIDMAAQILSRFISYWDTLTIRYIGNGQNIEAINKALRAMTIGFTVSGFFLLNFWLLGEWFLGLWVGEQYQYLVTDLMIMAGILFVSSLHASFTPLLNGHGLQKKDAFLTIMDVLAKVVLIIPLLHLLDLRGAIIATLIPGFIITLGPKLLVVAQATEVKYLLLIKKVFLRLLIIGLGVFMILSMHMLLDDLGGYFWFQVVVVMTLQVIFALLMWKRFWQDQFYQNT